jgi:hypothetical protein
LTFNAGVSDFRPKRIRKKGPKSTMKQKAKHPVKSKTSDGENIKMIKNQEQGKISQNSGTEPSEKLPVHGSYR